MIRIQKTNAHFCAAILSLVLILSLPSHAQNWQCEILPAERRIIVDSTSGADITFITTHGSNDTNLYFHDRCWMLDGKVMLFESDRTGREEIFGYIAQTGELIQFNRKIDSAAKFPEASGSGNKIYIVRDLSIYAWEVSLDTEKRTTVSISEKKLCEYPRESVPIHGLNENADGTLLSFGYQLNGSYHIAVVNTSTGVSDHITQMDYQIQHMQFSKSRSDLISYARSYGSDTAPWLPMKSHMPESGLST